MTDEPVALTISPALVGAKVQVAGRADWGVGVVLRVQSSTQAESEVHRVTVQFPHGTRVLVSPPARLVAPVEGPTRAEGWLDKIAGRTLDGRLRTLPESVVRILGTVRQKIDAVLPLYAYDSSPTSLLRWARWRCGAADPLSIWSRDELQLAYDAFCSDRDAHLRGLLAQLRLAEGAEAVSEVLSEIEEPERTRVLEAVRRPI